MIITASLVDELRLLLAKMCLQGVAAITQSILIVLSAAIFFAARSIGSDDGWGQDPLL
jgi:ABC-type multidrug transport system permease subunit